MAKERLYFKIEFWLNGVHDPCAKGYYYSCYNRTELHEFINERMEEFAFQWAKDYFWCYAKDYEDEFALFEAILPKVTTRIFEVPPKEFYDVDYATMRV